MNIYQSIANLDTDRLMVYSRMCTLLEKGATYANEAEVDAWQFAVPRKALQERGLIGADLRQLVSQGLLAHAVEETLEGGERRFLASASQRLDHERTCIVLTPAGREFAAEIGRRRDELILGGQLIPDSSDEFCPRWLPDERELYWHVWIVKKYSTRAEFHELILQRLEEKRWVRPIDDPLPAEPGEDRTERLHNVIRRLNGNQTACKINFFRDGKGRISWQKP